MKNLLKLMIFASVITCLFSCTSGKHSTNPSKKEKDIQMNSQILPSGWDPKLAGDKVLKGLVNVCSSQVKGAHDGCFVIADNKAYITYMANDVQPNENPRWTFIYNALSIVDIETGTIRKILPFASSEKVYENEKLPVGSCFVARILQKDKNTLRVFFASENPGVRQSQTWYIDFDLDTESFDNNIYKAKIKTKYGIFDMQPRYFFRDALAYGFTGDEPDYGLYPFDIKKVNNELYTSLSVFPFGPVGFGTLNKEMNTFEVVGYYFQPLEFKLNESALERLPDGSWMAITRQELGTRNYTFSSSKNGIEWTVNEYLDFVPNGTNAKPVFELFNGIYYLGWQEETQINNVFRSVYNIEVSRDGIHWERKYRFETEKSFQYPHLAQYEGSVYMAITQGDTDASRKERIMFGKLE
ncbi:MAG: exo-alpha-sialidase [Bacteroidales bacterium]|nr:exo-alpha-sialidase [Bacteroidales bacterium]